MHDHATDFARSYRFCRLGFFLLTVALVLVCAVDIPALVVQFVGRPARFGFWRRMQDSGALTLALTVTPWAFLAGSTLLWAAWDASAWRRRAGLLMVMCLVDAGCWILDQGDPESLGPHAYFRIQLGAALGWAEFALLAGLAGEILAHLGSESAEESARSMQSLAATGAVVWLLLFLETADLRGGWPLARNPRLTINALALWLAYEIIHTVCLVRATAIVLAAFRRLHAEILRREAEDADPMDFDPPSGRGDFTAV